jgi:hypothetical protein
LKFISSIQVYLRLYFPSVFFLLREEDHWSVSKSGLRIRILLDPCLFDLLDSVADTIVKTARCFKKAIYNMFFSNFFGYFSWREHSENIRKYSKVKKSCILCLGCRIKNQDSDPGPGAVETFDTDPQILNMYT